MVRHGVPYNMQYYSCFPLSSACRWRRERKGEGGGRRGRNMCAVSHLVWYVHVGPNTLQSNNILFALLLNFEGPEILKYLTQCCFSAEIPSESPSSYWVNPILDRHSKPQSSLRQKDPVLHLIGKKFEPIKNAITEEKFVGAAPRGILSSLLFLLQGMQVSYLFIGWLGWRAGSGTWRSGSVLIRADRTGLRAYVKW